MRTMGIRMEVKLTDGYQQRFTEACLKALERRKAERQLKGVTTCMQGKEESASLR